MTMTRNATAPILATLLLASSVAVVEAKDKVKVGFIGPLTGGVSVNGLGGRNSSDLAVRLRNADAKAKYEYELVVLDDECKPNVAVQVATKMAADKEIIAGGDALLLGRPRSRRSTPITSSACRWWSGARCCPTSPTATNMPRSIASTAP